MHSRGLRIMAASCLLRCVFDIARHPGVIILAKSTVRFSNKDEEFSPQTLLKTFRLVS